ncbi:MAG: hypothetical protein PUB54_08295, partial [Lachnospiraceae bacterium]|nr:hypothetical protein [Lachnospiraceae bacterium]
FKIFQCKDNKNINELIKYYNEYNIVESVKIEDIKSIKTITDHTDYYVNSLLLLNDGRVASCSRDKTIRIYDPSNDYHCDQVIKRHSKGIISICQLDDGTIVSCSNDKSIMIGDYTINNAHESWIYKVITLPNNRIASCSNDYSIKIWKSNPPYSDTPINVLKGHRYVVASLLYIKERDVMISGSGDDTLRLWNMSTYQCDKVIEGVRCCFINSLYQIDKDRVIVGGYKSFCVVNIDKCVIEKRIEDESLGYVFCLSPCPRLSFSVGMGLNFLFPCPHFSFSVGMRMMFFHLCFPLLQFFLLQFFLLQFFLLLRSSHLQFFLPHK